MRLRLNKRANATINRRAQKFFIKLDKVVLCFVLFFAGIYLQYYNEVSLLNRDQDREVSHII